jgi:hypothetical protein
MRELKRIGCALSFVPMLTLAGAGCRGGNTGEEMPMDLAMAADLTKATKPTTIRDINMPGGSIQVNDRVKFSGVVISPLMWVTADDRTSGDDYCKYRIAVMQADGSAGTLRDGMVVSVDLKTQFMGTGSKLDFCQDYGKKNAVVVAMEAVKSGDAVDVEGFLESFGQNGSRYVDPYNGRVTGNGPAPIKPVAVDADPTMFASGSPLPQAFVDASGVLVKLSNLMVSSRNASFQDFTVNTAPATDMGVSGGANIAANYMKVTVGSSFMAPMVGTTLMSVTGIVFGDFGGKVWPRVDTDIVP